MRGELCPYLPELTIRDYNTYIAYLRGVRSQLRRDYGLATSLLVRSESVTLAILCDSLAARVPTCLRRRSLRHPLRKTQEMSRTQGIRLAAQVQVLMAWHTVMDRSAGADGLPGRLQRLAFALLVRAAYQKAVDANPMFERLIWQQRVHAQTQRLLRVHTYEAACEPVANVFSAVYALAAPEDDTARRLTRRIGACIGKVYYLLSEARALQPGGKTAGQAEGQAYNIFAENGLNAAAAMEKARFHCIEAVDELVPAYNLLDIKLNRTLLDNILVVSLRHLVDSAGKPQEVQAWEIP